MNFRIYIYIYINVYMELTILQITNICLFFTCSYRIPTDGNSIQRECLKCLKAMMSNEFGLDMILLHKDVLMSVAKLINTDSPNVMKVNILPYFVMWQASENPLWLKSMRCYYFLFRRL